MPFVFGAIRDAFLERVKHLKREDAFFIMVNAVFIDSLRDQDDIRFMIKRRINEFSSYIHNMKFNYSVHFGICKLHIYEDTSFKSTINDALIEVDDEKCVEECCLFAYFTNSVLRIFDQRMITEYRTNLQRFDLLQEIKPKVYKKKDIVEQLEWLIPFVKSLEPQEYGLPEINPLFSPLDQSMIDSYLSGISYHPFISYYFEREEFAICRLFYENMDMKICTPTIRELIYHYCRSHFNYRDYCLMKNNFNFNDFSVNKNIWYDIFQNQSILDELPNNESFTLCRSILTRKGIMNDTDFDFIQKLIPKASYEYKKCNREMAKFYLNAIDSRISMDVLKTRLHSAESWFFPILKDMADHFKLSNKYDKIMEKFNKHEFLYSDKFYIDKIKRTEWNFDYNSEALENWLKFVRMNLKPESDIKGYQKAILTLLSKNSDIIVEQIPFDSVKRIESTEYQYNGVNLYKLNSEIDKKNTSLCKSGKEASKGIKQCVMCCGSKKYLYRICLGKGNQNCGYYACLNCWKRYIDERGCNTIRCIGCRGVVKALSGTAFTVYKEATYESLLASIESMIEECEKV